MSRTFASILPLSLVVAACGGDRGDNDTTGTSDGGTAESSGGTAGEEPAVTYYRDVKAILDAKCVQCHSPENIAPFSLQSYDEAKTFAPTLVASIDAATMPPWPPDAACRSYKHDRSLAGAEKETIRTWVDLGAPEGDPADAPAPDPGSPGEAIDYNVELELPEPYTPTIAPDEYRCFLLPWPEDQDSYVTAVHVVPGEKQLVHHVIAYTVDPVDVAAYQALDDADADPGYLCYGGPGGDAMGGGGRAPWLGAWAPGGAGGATPEGTGLHVKPGSMIAVQMHYHTYPGAGPDQSKIRFRVEPSVDRVAVVLPFTNYKWVTGSEPMLIPAGDADASHNFEADVTDYLPVIFPGGPFQAGDPFVVHSASLHMHTLGTSATLGVVGGTNECLLDIPRWDFAWQGNYQLMEPVTVRQGDRLRLECHWDNSAKNQPIVDGAQQEPADVLWGEGTGDEMCLGIVYITGV